MRKLKWVQKVFLLGIIALCSCQNEQVDPKAPVQIRELSLMEQKVVEQSNQFGMDLLQQVNHDMPGSNFFISPFSVSMGLGMVLNGATDSTLLAVQRTLGIKDMDNLEVNKGYNDLINLLPDIDQQVNFIPANALWYRQDLHVQEMSRDIISAYYQAAIEELDFNNQKSDEIVNKWVENRTNKKIRELLKGVKPEDAMYLINAVYFKAPWSHAFDKSYTTLESFYMLDNKSIDINFMYSKATECGLYQDESITLLDLPYSNKQYSMTFIMPSKTGDFKDFMSNLTPLTLDDYYAQLDTTNVDVYVPKFSASSKIDLKPVLRKMGLGIAFSDSASFDNLFKDSPISKLDKVIHEAYLDINEQGIEPASSLPPVPTTHKYAITINQPFLFFIREKHTGALLFTGKFVSPTIKG